MASRVGARAHSCRVGCDGVNSAINQRHWFDERGNGHDNYDYSRGADVNRQRLTAIQQRSRGEG
jgi:hypothetical protein